MNAHIAGTVDMLLLFVPLAVITALLYRANARREQRERDQAQRPSTNSIRDGHARQPREDIAAAAERSTWR